jgi:hypothetical protein
LQIEGRAIALAGVGADELGLLARPQAMERTPSNVDEIIEAIGVPQGPFGEDEPRGQAFRFFRFEDRRQRIRHSLTPRAWDAA